jgi:hypothetical protein
LRTHRRVPRLVLGAALALGPLSARADPTQTETSLQGSDDATVVFVGDNAGRNELAAVLVELLQRNGVRVRLLSEPRFEPASLLSGGEGDRTVRVFIELRDPHMARLYFRGPEARRFLLRELEMRDGLDEFGRELIAQVVESSVTALLHSSAGLSRDQVRAALVEQNQLPAPDSIPRDEAPHAQRASEDVARFTGWLGLKYAGQWSGSDLGGVHGPGGEIGIEWRGGASSRSAERTPIVRTTFSAERWFSQTVTSQQVKASLQSWPLRLGVDVGWPRAHGQTWLFGLAGGVDLTRIEPEAGDPSVTASAASVDVVPMLRAALRYEFGTGPWRLAFTAYADVSLLATHYDLARGSSFERLAAPWPVRPGAALVLAWQPTLGAR